MDTIAFGRTDTTHSEYGLTQNSVIVNEKPSVYKAIMRNGELVAILSKWYHLVPNEKALEIAKEAAKLAGMEPFQFERGNSTVYNRRRTYMHAWFIPKEGVEVRGPVDHQWAYVKDDRVQIGVDVRNSIDGSSSFGCGLFTWREICSNGVILGYQALGGLTKIHTKGLQLVIDNLKNTMVLLMDQAKDIIFRYRQMAEQALTDELIKKIRESAIPKKVLPDYAKVKEEQTQLADLSTLTEWELYNDITELIWHNQEADITTKEDQFRVLHNAMPLRVT